MLVCALQMSKEGEPPLFGPKLDTHGSPRPDEPLGPGVEREPLHPHQEAPVLNDAAEGESPTGPREDLECVSVEKAEDSNPEARSLPANSGEGCVAPDANKTLNETKEEDQEQTPSPSFPNPGTAVF